jgi:transaldolase
MQPALNTQANPLGALAALGQSVWLDDLDRTLLREGALKRMIAEDAVTGVTTNPSIFEKAIAGGSAYRGEIRALASKGCDPPQIAEQLMADDVRVAADLLAAAHERSGGADGYVSFEVPPDLAFDAGATIRAAHRLWERVARPNLMIKVPATAAGLEAIPELIGAGINVNVTLLFSVDRYRRVAAAYARGLEKAAAAGLSVQRIASVASFFVSRIDTLVDGLLDALPPGTPDAQALRGAAAVASARLAYQASLAIRSGAPWQALARRGAHPQRLLWASTATKDARYSDVKYVDALAGADTVVTLPRATLAAFRDHGQPAPRVNAGLAEAQALPERLAALGIDLEDVAGRLERDGVAKFQNSYDGVIAAVRREVPVAS